MSKLALALRTGDCLYNTFLEKGQTLTFGGKKDGAVVSDFEPKQISVKWKDNDELLVDARKRYGYYGAGAVNGLTPLTGDADPLLYNGVLYPFGLTLPGELLQFDQDDIHELLFADHETEKSEAVCKVLPVLHAHICPDFEKLSELKKKMESPAPAG